MDTENNKEAYLKPDNNYEVTATSLFEDEIDLEFIRRVQAEVTSSCALPLAVPIERIPEFIRQAAMWFWQNANTAVENRFYVIPYHEFCKGNAFNKIVKLPVQIMSIQGAYRTRSGLKYGTVGDFSLERMMMSSYSLFGGVGTIGSGFSGSSGVGQTGYNLTDVITSLYEVQTFRDYLDAPITYDFNMFSKKFCVLGDIRYSDVLIDCWKRIHIQDLYQDYYFFRFVVCLVKRSLATIYGTFEFKLPGGVQINYSNFTDQADTELDEIKEYIKDQYSADYFFMPNTL